MSVLLIGFSRSLTNIMGMPLFLNQNRTPVSEINDINIGDHLYSILKGGELKMEVLNKNVKNRKK